MSKERFLLWLLASIFTYQAGIFAFGLVHCSKTGGLKACPEIGKRYDQTFAVMISTTLALLTGSAISKKEDE